MAHFVLISLMGDLVARLLAQSAAAVREVIEILDLPGLVMAAVAFLLTGMGTVLVVAAIGGRRENAEVRARGEKPSRRNASPGCLLVVGVPLLLLGGTIVGFLIWVAVRVAMM